MIGVITLKKPGKGDETVSLYFTDKRQCIRTWEWLDSSKYRDQMRSCFWGVQSYDDRNRAIEAIEQIMEDRLKTSITEKTA